ncbi:hypothetical protein B0A48_18660 [Cryoendolithus antarcticus]|uniref:Uncharacterized protein n=1 Tax=Cryoendolithus antarcticus TaxID=1507870 RepID=A0A1V8S7T1_9PEZI|nr:hypothetical protein B0A48_18660 [Cryoendolithus antarcticus]
MLAFEKLGRLKRPVRATSPLGWTYGGNILGGIMVGIGMSITGACPGTVLVQIAQGIHTAQAVALGGLLAGATYSFVTPHLNGRLQNDAHPPIPTTVTQSTRVPEPVVYGTLGISIIGMLAVFRTWHVTAGMSPAASGAVIGLTQMAALFLTAAPLGVSTAYEKAGQHLLQLVRVDKSKKAGALHKSIILATAMVIGSMAFTAVAGLDTTYDKGLAIPFWQALVGGFIMVFGARLGGGCTSGHGLSGTSTLSSASFVSVVGMFGAGIASRAILVPALRNICNIV